MRTNRARHFAANRKQKKERYLDPLPRSYKIQGALLPAHTAPADLATHNIKITTIVFAILNIKVERVIVRGIIIISLQATTDATAASTE